MNARTRSSVSATPSVDPPTVLWTADPPPLTAVAQCQDGAAHAAAVCAGSGPAGAAPARRRRADPAAPRGDRRRAGHPATGHAFAGIDQRAATPFRLERR